MIGSIASGPAAQVGEQVELLDPSFRSAQFWLLLASGESNNEWEICFSLCHAAF